jgi:hypothetical protein
MSLSNHLIELSSKHLQLEKMIREEQSKPGADETKIRRWKHEKLRLKDEMAKYRPPTRH